MATVTVKEALQRVVNYPKIGTDDIVNMPTHELVARTLFDIANNPDPSVRGAANRANRARKMIFERLVGKRRAGSHPATRTEVNLEFHDLTGGELE